MLFSSVTFLFCFLPFVIIFYYIINPVLRNLFLLIASLFFYAWGEPKYLLVMVGVIGLNYVLGLLISEFGRHKKIFLILAVVGNLSILFFFKYIDFVIININSVTGFHLGLYKIALPIGISFYIFQSMSYIIDLYKGNVFAQYNICKFALYVSLFPQLIAGPIVKYRDIASEIDSRSVSLDDIVEGIRRFIIGLGKKVLLANTLGEVTDKVFLAGTSDISISIAWLGAICYSLQIFFDFSGYSDMAIGLGRVFGFHFLENFNYPYISSSVTEFWRRWHISLSTWFKEYLYIPLGGNRVSKMRNTFNLLIVFFATGLWHGASWNFVIWGLWHGLFLMIEKRILLSGNSEITLFHKLSRHIYVILVFVFGWVFFRAENLSVAIDYISVMVGLKTNPVVGFGLLYYLNRKIIIILIVSCLFCYPWNYDFFKKYKGGFIAKDILLFLILVSSIASIASSGYNPFIYFRF